MMPTEGAARRRGPQANPMMLAVVLPLAASCLLAVPTSSQSQWFQRDAPRCEVTATTQERERRAEDYLAAAWPRHDPPRPVLAWQAGKAPSDAVQECPPQQACLMQSCAGRPDPSVPISPFFEARPCPQRGPPAGADIR